jgi:thioredoxin
MKKIVVILIVVVFSSSTTIFAKTGDKTSPEETVTTNNNTKAIHLTTSEFKSKVFNYEVNKDWKYNGTVPCIVDFYTTWCGPCKRLAPVLEDLAKEYDGEIIVYKIDTEKEPELAQVFGIRSIPTLLFIPKTGQPQMAKGALAKEQLVKVINEFLLKK